MEYGIAGSIHYALLESAACEMASRMIAMDNATTNASDMRDAMQLKYNRCAAAAARAVARTVTSGGGCGAQSTAGKDHDRAHRNYFRG